MTKLRFYFIPSAKMGRLCYGRMKQVLHLRYIMQGGAISKGIGSFYEQAEKKYRLFVIFVSR